MELRAKSPVPSPWGTLSGNGVPPGFHDARDLEDGRELACDVCIVGSGAAGTTAALRLRERGRSVLLIESAGADPDPTTSTLSEVEAADLPIGPEARTRTLGGTTSVWWGCSGLLSEMDFARRPWLDVPGWPIERSGLMPYYVQACRVLGIPDLTRVTVDRFRSPRGFLVETDQLDTVALYWPRRPRRFRDLLEPAVRRDRELQAYLYANVTRIVPGAGRRNVERVEIRTISGRRLTVRPKVLVLACGGIENARLLLASGGEGTAGLGNDRDLVGRFYMDHPKGVAGVIRVDTKPGSMPHAGYWDSRPGRFRLGIRISPDRQRREALLDGYVRFDPVIDHWMLGVDALRELRRRGGSALLDAGVIRGCLAGAPDLVRFARLKILNRGAVEIASIENFIEQRPRPENRVRLSHRADLFGNPLPRLEWSIDAMERRTMRHLHTLLGEDLTRRGFGKVDSPLLGDPDEPWPISRDASHHMGTTRMGNDPASSVVDRNCQVHGIDNLYVAGSSVFSTSGSANPTLTIVALALRLADHLGESR